MWSLATEGEGRRERKGGKSNNMDKKRLKLSTGWRGSKGKGLLWIGARGGVWGGGAELGFLLYLIIFALSLTVRKLSVCCLSTACLFHLTGVWCDVAMCQMWSTLALPYSGGTFKGSLLHARTWEAWSYFTKSLNLRVHSDWKYALRNCSHQFIGSLRSIAVKLSCSLKK